MYDRKAQRCIMLPESEPAAAASDNAEQQFRLNLLAEEVRTAYTVGRMTYGRKDYDPSYWDGGDGSDVANGRRRSNAWIALAQFCLEHDLEPLPFIQINFEGCLSNRLPTPWQLRTAKAVQRYRERMGDMVSRLRTQLANDLLSIRSEAMPLQQTLQWTYERSLRYALFNVTTVFASPLTRFCLAAEHQFWDIVAHFHDQALVQYVFLRPSYDEAWGLVIPGTLREEAAQYRRA